MIKIGLIIMELAGPRLKGGKHRVGREVQRYSDEESGQGLDGNKGGREGRRRRLNRWIDGRGL